ncbi:alpha-(1-_6)-mannopyranosyltransferase A [Rhodococcus erythropolis]
MTLEDQRDSRSPTLADGTKGTFSLPTIRSDIAAMVRSKRGRAAMLGFLGAVLTTVGGFGAGSTLVTDRLLEDAHLSWMRFGHGLVLSSMTAWVGVACMIVAWIQLGRIALVHNVALNELRIIVGMWILPLIFAVPMFSRDTYSYLAQGALLRDGFDPYRVGAAANPGVFFDNVSAVWINTPSPYGPGFLLIAEGITKVVGNNLVAGTILMRLAMLPGLALMVWAVPYLARHFHGKPVVALWLAVLNPLVLIHLIGGVHNETLMVGLMVAGIALALKRKHIAGIALISIGFTIKAMAALALPFIVWIWVIHERERREAAGEGPEPYPMIAFAKCASLGAIVFASVYGAASVTAGVGIGWVSALQGSNQIKNWLSLPTVLAHAVTWFTPLGLDPVLSVTRPICWVVLIAVLVGTWWRFRRSEQDAVAGIAIALIAVVILSPAALPWYYSWPLAVGACFVISPRLLMFLAGICTFVMLVFLPDGPPASGPLHVALALLGAVVAAISLRFEDPLRLRAQKARRPR